jgi:putative flippase GtrA
MPAALQPVVLPSSVARYARCGASGLLATATDAVTMILLVEAIGVAPAAAAAAAALAGAIVAFALNRRWAFRDPRPLAAGHVARFAIVALGSAAIGAALVHLLTAAPLAVPYLAARLAAAALAFVTFTYPAQSRLVFARPSPATEEAT